MHKGWSSWYCCFRHRYCCCPRKSPYLNIQASACMMVLYMYINFVCHCISTKVFIGKLPSVHVHVDDRVAWWWKEVMIMDKQISYTTLIGVHSNWHAFHAPQLMSCDYILCTCVCTDVIYSHTRMYTHWHTPSHPHSLTPSHPPPHHAPVCLQLPPIFPAVIHGTQTPWKSSHGSLGK